MKMINACVNNNLRNTVQLAKTFFIEDVKWYKHLIENAILCLVKRFSRVMGFSVQFMFA